MAVVEASNWLLVAISSRIVATSPRIVSTAPAMKPIRFSSSELFMTTFILSHQPIPIASGNYHGQYSSKSDEECCRSRRRHIGFTHIKICGNLLHIVVVFKRFHQLHHLTCLWAFEFDVVLWNHFDLGDLWRDAG